jgi:AraC family transcriptional activator of pobA
MKAPASSGAAVPGGQVALYPMSIYTRGIRKPGHYHVISFGRTTNKLDRLVPEPHRHDFFEIIWVRHGSGEVWSDFGTHPVRPCTLFFSAPGQVHAWKLAAPARGHIASFREEFLGVTGEDPALLGKLPFFYGETQVPLLHLDTREAQRVDHVFRQISLEAAELLPGRDDLVRSYLTILLTHARQAFGRRAAGAAPPAVDLLARRFRLALEEHFATLREVGDYARLLGVSRTHLNDHLQQNLGRTASELIQERVVLEAKRLLLHSAMTVAQVAYRLRFQDPSHFGRFFRRIAGCTPGEFRERAQADALAS